MNNTSESYTMDFDLNCDVHLKTVRVARTVILITLALTTYFGNTLILISLKKFSKYLKGIQFILLWNLAVADILLAVGLTLEVFGTVFVSLDINRTFCIVKLLVTGISISTSGRLLIFISLDRFFAIIFPMKHLAIVQKTRYRRIHLAVLWIVSVLVPFIPLFIRLRSPRILQTCYLGWLISGFVSIYSSLFILLQFCINVILCLIIMWRLRTNTISRQKYKAVMLKCGYLIKGYVLFFICWMPFVVTSILMAISNDKQKYASIREYAIAPGLVNSAMNWIIYGYANAKLRAALKNVILCRNKKDMFLSTSVNVARSRRMPSEKNEEQKDIMFRIH